MAVAIAHLADMPGGTLASAFVVGPPKTQKTPVLGVLDPFRFCSCRPFGPKTPASCRTRKSDSPATGRKLIRGFRAPPASVFGLASRFWVFGSIVCFWKSDQPSTSLKSPCRDKPKSEVFCDPNGLKTCAKSVPRFSSASAAACSFLGASWWGVF